MSLEQGFTIIDSALDLAMSHLEQHGLPKDDAQIALLIRLRNIVPQEVAKMADLLSDDDELSVAINQKNVFEQGELGNY